MHMQSTTAHLLCRYPKGAAVRLQHPGTGVMHLGEQQIHDAAGEKSDLLCHWRLARQDGRNAAGKRPGQHLWQGRLQALEQSRKQLQNVELSHQVLQTQTLIPAQDVPEELETSGMRKQLLKDQAPQETLRPGTWEMTLNLSARLFHQVAKLHVRGTRRLTRPTVEAEIHVLDEVRRHRQASVIYRFDEVDAPTWRVHLSAQGAIGRTFIETQAAMDTRSNFVSRRPFTLIETGQRR